MDPHAIDIGAVDQRLVGGRVIALDPLDQLILTQQLGPRFQVGLRRDQMIGGRILRRREGKRI
jgi:hypothetical protein